MSKNNNQVLHFMTFGIIKVLLVHSQTALFLFVFPFWLFFFSQLGIVIGRLVSNVPFATGLYCLSGFCFLMMLGSLWLGFRSAQGVSRLVGLIQIGLSTIFVLVASWRNVVGPIGPPFEPDSIECVLSVFVMFVLFVITVLSDVSRAFTDRRALE